MYVDLDFLGDFFDVCCYSYVGGKVMIFFKKCINKYCRYFSIFKWGI